MLTRMRNQNRIFIAALASLLGTSNFNAQSAAFTSFVSAISTTKKAALLALAVAATLAGSAAKARGQSALDGFDPNANNLVLVVVVQPDGKILLGGGFVVQQRGAGADHGVQVDLLTMAIRQTDRLISTSSS